MPNLTVRDIPDHVYARLRVEGHDYSPPRAMSIPQLGP